MSFRPPSGLTDRWRGSCIRSDVRAVYEGQCGLVIVHLVGVAVVGLGAWSELARRDQLGMDIDVHEFAVLDDRRLTLHRDRGFSTSATHLTAEHLKSSVLTTVLPNDAEVTGEDHPWEWLASLIQIVGPLFEDDTAITFAELLGEAIGGYEGPPL
jgi:hypothetical protein